MQPQIQHEWLVCLLVGLLNAQLRRYGVIVCSNELLSYWFFKEFQIPFVVQYHSRVEHSGPAVVR